MKELLLHPRTKSYAAVLREPGVYIVHGPKAIGKTSFASSLLNDYRPITVRPDEKGIIGVKTLKELASRLSYKVTESAEVVLIDDAHVMTTAAQNAFLKTLEELPLNVRVVLVTHHLYGLLPTVRSRCQTLYMPAPTRKQFKGWLDEAGKPVTADTLKEYRFTPAPAAVFKTPAVKDETLEKVPALFGNDLYSRLAAAKQLSSALPDILPFITAYVRRQLRSGQDSKDWQRYLEATISSSRLSEARVSDRTLLDVIAIAGGSGRG